jgi:leucyl aminopeptidase
MLVDRSAIPPWTGQRFHRGPVSERTLWTVDGQTRTGDRTASAAQANNVRERIDNRRGCAKSCHPGRASVRTNRRPGGYRARAMEVATTTQPGKTTDADTVAVGVFDGADPPQLPAELRELLASGEARRSFKALALTHAEGKRWLAVGLGERAELTPERARVAAAVACERAREISTRALCWETPSNGDAAIAGALAQGTILSDYRFERHKSTLPDGEHPADEAATKRLERLIISAPGPVETTVAEAALIANAVNRARDLQNRPGNDLTPSALAEHAGSLAAEIESLSVEVEGREGITARGMGAFAAVAQGSEQEPALITIHYEGPGADAPTLGFVGKAVTFDSGGISLKPGAKMAEMKFDMSGGAAVIEAVGAIARLQLPLRLVAVVGATENLPSGRSVKPGDIVTAANGKTIEVNNTDAEGRLVLADCLCHAITEGAERIVDLATLTGAVIIALGSTYAGLMSNDEELAERITGAGERTGEIVWRLPLHEEYRALVKGQYGDLDNAPEARKAGTIVGATFLSNFVGDVPWAHLDIAGSAWDLGRAYVGKGASGYGVRLLVELARSYCD